MTFELTYAVISAVLIYAVAASIMLESGAEHETLRPTFLVDKLRETSFVSASTVLQHYVQMESNGANFSHHFHGMRAY